MIILTEQGWRTFQPMNLNNPERMQWQNHGAAIDQHTLNMERWMAMPRGTIDEQREAAQAHIALTQFYNKHVRPGFRGLI